MSENTKTSDGNSFDRLMHTKVLPSFAYLVLEAWAVCGDWQQSKCPHLPTKMSFFILAHAHTNYTAFCCVLVLCQFAPPSSFLLKLSSCLRYLQTSCSLTIKATERRQESLFPQAPEARHIKRGERGKGDGGLEERRTVALTSVDYRPRSQQQG